MSKPRPSFRPQVEMLEDRCVPALIASKVPLAALPELTMSVGDVKAFLNRAAAATPSDDAIVAIVDRDGNILGVRVEGNVAANIKAAPAFAIDGAVALARTAAFFSSNNLALTSRSIRFISQTSITQRMVDSSFYVAGSSTAYGPGTVAPVGPGGNYPPGVDFTPIVDLFGIEFTNRAPAPLSGGKPIYNTSSYAAAISPAGTGPISRGIATLPGGIPLYKDGVLVGGIGVFFPGTTGYASAENSSLSKTYDPTKPDRSLEAEFVAFASEGSTAAGFPAVTLGGAAPVPGYDLPDVQVDLAGITIDGVGAGGASGASNLFKYATGNFAIGMGDAFSGVNEPVKAGQVPTSPKAAIQPIIPGSPVPSGWLIGPKSGVGITAAQVQQIVGQGINTANQTRAQIRQLGSTARMVFTVTDETGAIVGLYRMPDATVFSIDVSLAKARNVAYYDNPAQLLTTDEVPGIPAGVSFTARTFRFLAQAYYPEGIEGSPPGFFSPLNDPGIDPRTGLETAPPLPASYTSEVAYTAFNPTSNFHQLTKTGNKGGNGVVFFPGSAGIYAIVKGQRTIIAGLGVSGDGVLQDDFVTAGADAGFGPPDNLRADMYSFSGIRLPYLKFPRNPTDI
jgi:uncharacterized protein GlcG (DUF336 family)